MTRHIARAALMTFLLALSVRPVEAQSALGDTVRQQAERFIAALAAHDIDQFVGLFAGEPDFIYVDGGRIYLDRAALRNAGARFVGSIKTFNAKWDPTKILVLGPDGAVFTGVMQVQAADTTGKVIWPNGKIWTLVYQRRGGRWLIVQAQEATVPAPRP
jgi:uncharacterized protein (TIGR02246 family)